MSDVVNDDLMERYGKTKPVQQTYLEREDALSRQQQEPDSLVGFLTSGATTELNGIISDLSSGDPGRIAKAKQGLDDFNDTLRLNSGNINQFRNYTGGGALATQCRNMSEFLGTNKHLQMEVTMPDGRTTTLGKAFADPEIVGDPGRGFVSNGADRGLVSAWLSGEYTLPDGQKAADPMLKEALGNYIPKDSSGRPEQTDNRNAMFHEQANQGGLAILNNWGRVKQVFGDGAPMFARMLHQHNIEVGGFQHLVPALLDWGEAHSSRSGITGTRLASYIMGSLGNFATGAVQGDPDADGRTARPVTANKRRIINATAVKALAAMERTGQDLDLSDPSKISAMNESLSMISQMTASGVDIFGGEDGGNGRRLIDRFAEHVANAGTPMARSGFVFDWYGDDTTPGFSRILDTLVTGGVDFTQVGGKYTSPDVNDWLKLQKASGGHSTCPIADTMGVGLKNAIRASVAPVAANGVQPENALQTVLRDPDRADVLVARMTKEVMRNGVASERAAQYIVGHVLNSVRNHTTLNLQTLIRDTAFNDQVAREDPEIAKSLRNWYYASVAAPMQFAEEHNATLAHLMDPDGGGLSQMEAMGVMSSLGLQVADVVNRSKRNGGDLAYNPARVYQSARRSGYYYEQEPTGRTARKYTVNLDAVRIPVEDVGIDSAGSSVKSFTRSDHPDWYKQVMSGRRSSWTRQQYLDMDRTKKQNTQDVKPKKTHAYGLTEQE